LFHVLKPGEGGVRWESERGKEIKREREGEREREREGEQCAFILVKRTF
jgi:hypothetical protein